MRCAGFACALHELCVSFALAWTWFRLGFVLAWEIFGFTLRWLLKMSTNKTIKKTGARKVLSGTLL